MRRATRELIISEARRLGARTRGPLKLARFLRANGFTTTQVYYRFPHGWRSVLQEAGLGAQAFTKDAVPEGALRAEVARITRRLGRSPTWREFVRLRSKRYRLAEVRRTLGPGEDAIRHYFRWRGKRNRGARHERGIVCAARRRPGGAGEKLLGRPYCRDGLLHEPVSELGVVHAAGVLWREAGLLISRMSKEFPDAEALIRVRRDGRTWRRVRAEFELRSSHFKQHRHDPAGCDLIVCWEHDWPECPVEVLELRPLAMRPARGDEAGA